MINLINKSLLSNKLQDSIQFKRTGVILIVLSLSFFTSIATANTHNNSITISYNGSDTTKYKIATLHVLSEICPPMLNRQQRAGFNRSFNHNLSLLMPDVQNPNTVLHYLSTQHDYKVILNKMRKTTMSDWQDSNHATCSAMANGYI